MENFPILIVLILGCHIRTSIIGRSHAVCLLASLGCTAVGDSLGKTPSGKDWEDVGITQRQACILRCHRRHHRQPYRRHIAAVSSPHSRTHTLARTQVQCPAHAAACTCHILRVSIMQFIHRRNVRKTKYGIFRLQWDSCCKSYSLNSWISCSHLSRLVC